MPNSKKAGEDIPRGTLVIRGEDGLAYRCPLDLYVETPIRRRAFSLRWYDADGNEVPRPHQDNPERPVACDEAAKVTPEQYRYLVERPSRSGPAKGIALYHALAELDHALNPSEST
jgi:hypothetical protein